MIGAPLPESVTLHLTESAELATVIRGEADAFALFCRACQFYRGSAFRIEGGPTLDSFRISAFHIGGGPTRWLVVRGFV